MAGYHRRRRRIRADPATRPGFGGRAAPAAPDDPADDEASAATRPVHDPEPTVESGPVARPAPPPGRPGADDVDDRGLRGVVGSGSTQVGVSAAARARDAARPTAADIAAAEANLVIVRRNWVPRAEPR